jgi:hypothetical protein
MDVEGVAVERLEQVSVRRAFHADAPFLLDDFPFRLEVLFGDVERFHPVRFHPQNHFQVVRRESFPVDRHVVGCVRIDDPAHTRDPTVEFLRLDVGRAFEHEVLEEMGETRAARLFVLGSDVVPELEVDDRRGMILVRDNGQPVVEPFLAVLERRRHRKPLRRLAVTRHRQDQSEQDEVCNDPHMPFLDSVSGSRYSSSLLPSGN